MLHGAAALASHAFPALQVFSHHLGCPPSARILQVILRKLALELMCKLDDELKHSTAQHAAFYEHRLQVSRRAAWPGSMAAKKACVAS